VLGENSLNLAHFSLTQSAQSGAGDVVSRCIASAVSQCSKSARMSL